MFLATALAGSPIPDTLHAGPAKHPIALHATFDSLETWSVSNGVRKEGRPYSQRLTRVGDAWRLDVHYFDEHGQLNTTQAYECDARTLEPTRVSVHATTDSAEVYIHEGYVLGYVAPAGQPFRALDQHLLHAPFEHDFGHFVIAAQKLSPSWSAVVSLYEPFRTGDPEFVWETRVTGRERISAVGGTRDCWVVEERDPSGQFATNTLWIDARTRRVWQSRGRPAGGTFEWWHRVVNP